MEVTREEYNTYKEMIRGKIEDNCKVVSDLKDSIKKLSDTIVTESEIDNKVTNHRNTCPYVKKIKDVCRETYEIESNKEIKRLYDNIKFKIIGTIVAGILALIGSILVINNNTKSQYEELIKEQKRYYSEEKFKTLKLEREEKNGYSNNY